MVACYLWGFISRLKRLQSLEGNGAVLVWLSFNYVTNLNLPEAENYRKCKKKIYIYVYLKTIQKVLCYKNRKLTKRNQKAYRRNPKQAKLALT